MIEYYCPKCGNKLSSISIGYLCGKCKSYYDKELIETTPVEEKEFVPIIHAHIVTNWLGDSSCSNCGTKYIDVNSKYCSECGAKFDESPVDKDRFSKEGD